MRHTRTLEGAEEGGRGFRHVTILRDLSYETEGAREVREQKYDIRWDEKKATCISNDQR